MSDRIASASRASSRYQTPSPDDAPDPGQLLEALSELFKHGSSRYRAVEAPIKSIDELAERLAGEERELLLAYEQRSNELADLWGEDRFRIGYALGAALGRIIE